MRIAFSLDTPQSTKVFAFWHPSVLCLRAALVRRTRAQDRLLEPVLANGIVDLEPLLTELQLADGFSQDMCAGNG
jgi:hypothetical protein